MKKSILFGLLTILAFNAFSYDYREVIFSNSWQNMELCDSESDLKMIGQYEKMSGLKLRKNKWLFRQNNLPAERYKDVYRIISSDNIDDITKITAWDEKYSFSQALIVEYDDFDKDNFYFYEPVDFGGHKKKYYSSVTITANNILFSIYDESDSEQCDRLWIADPSRCLANSYSKIAVFSDVFIKASKPLIDSKRPVKYTVQNMFDDNPETSYVEDTPDNLMKITIEGRKIPKKYGMYVYMVNGYLASSTLFNNNNRVKTIRIGENEYDVDNYYWNEYSSKYSTHNKDVEVYVEACSPLVIEVTEIEKGEKYNDTCIAELDLRWEEDSDDGPNIVRMLGSSFFY